MKPIERAIALFGSQLKLAEAAGCTGQAVSAWATGRRAISGRSARMIEAATGGAVTRHELAPEIFGDAPVRGRKRRPVGQAHSA